MRGVGRFAGLCVGLVLGLLLGASQAWAGQVGVAVAANFTEAAKEIAGAFKARTGHEAVLSFGSSGQLVSQIGQGAPFEVFLSADEARPKRLVEEGLGVRGSVFSYAVGWLVLWSRAPGMVRGEATLAGGGFEKLAICNPVAAPYGAASVEVLKALKLYEALGPKLVEGASIAQAYQFVATGNAEVGFVALSQVARDKAGSRWVVPQELYRPIRQDAVLLERGVGNEAAVAFLAFLKGAEGRAIIESYGYAAGGE